MNYRVSPSSPTDELLTVGRILSELGDYASTVLDREHLSLSRRCVTRLNKVVDELVSRRIIQSAENLHDLPEPDPSLPDLRSMTVAELHSHYRRWPARREDRQEEGRETFSFFHEGRIVRELHGRTAADRAEQLMIDYCDVMYRNELDNMSFVFSCPVRTDEDKIYPQAGRNYRTEDLVSLIRLYAGYRDITEREILVEYVDLALDWLEKEKDAASHLGLLAEVAELGRRKTIRIPEWVNKRLADAVGSEPEHKTGREAESVTAMLTLLKISKDMSLERRAQRLINRCYRSVFDGGADLGERIDNLHTAVTCCDYVHRFSVRKSATVWNELSAQALSAEEGLTAGHTYRLLEIAEECEGYAPICTESKDRLKRLLDDMAQSGGPEARALNEIVRRKIRRASRSHALSYEKVSDLDKRIVENS